MSSKEPFDPALERALRDLPRPIAAADFRARSKAEFLAGTAESAPRQVPTRTRAFPLVWPLVLAASVAFLLYFVMARDNESRWHVLEARADGKYVVDELPVAAADVARFTDLLQTARRIETGDAGLRMRLGDQLLLELGPDTTLSQLRFPAAGMFSFRADKGSVRVSTGPDFHGNSLRVYTDHMESSVVGTTFGLDVESGGTCLCCIDGVVKCDAHDGAGVKPVEAGGMCFAFPNQAAAKRGPAVGAHVEPLRALQEAARAAFGR